MDEKFLSLFKYIAQFSENTAEKAMQEKKKANLFKEYKDFSDMREKFRTLREHIEDKNHIFTKEDISFLILGAHMFIKNLESRMEQEQIALKGYKEITLPKLRECLANPEKINEIFSLND